MVKEVSRVFFLLIFFSTLLFGSISYDKLYKNINSYSKTKIQKIYTDSKNGYIKAIIGDDKKEQLDILKKLKLCAVKLGKPYRHYEEEIKLLTKELKSNKKSSVKNFVKNKISKKSKKNHKEKPKVISYPYISKVYYKNGAIRIVFNRKVDERSFKSYVLKKSSYKYIYDFKANLRTKGKRFSIKGLKRVVISQNRKNLVRLVIESSKRLKIDVKPKKKYSLHRA